MRKLLILRFWFFFWRPVFYFKVPSTLYCLDYWILGNHRRIISDSEKTLLGIKTVFTNSLQLIQSLTDWSRSPHSQESTSNLHPFYSECHLDFVFRCCILICNLHKCSFSNWCTECEYQKDIAKHNAKKITQLCVFLFHPDRPPVGYQVEIWKVVEKADVET